MEIISAPLWIEKTSIVGNVTTRYIWVGYAQQHSQDKHNFVASKKSVHIPWVSDHSSLCEVSQLLSLSIFSSKGGCKDSKEAFEDPLMNCLAKMRAPF